MATTVWSLTTMSIPVKSQGRYAEALRLGFHALRELLGRVCEQVPPLG